MGIAAFLLGLVPVVGVLAGAAAVVLGWLALVRRQAKTVAVIGLILGGVAALSSITVTGVGVAVTASSAGRAGSYAVATSTPVSKPATSPKPAASPKPASSPKPTAAPAPTPVVSAPAPAAPPPAPAPPPVPVEYKSALIKAQSYSEIMHMSKAGIYDQLTSEYGEKFSPEAAQYAVDTMVVDWNANALAKAKEYQEIMAMSPEAIRDQLTSDYGEKFTPEQADYAVQNLGG